MFNVYSIWQGIFDSSSQSVIKVSQFLLCIGISLILGLIIAIAYAIKNKTTKSFLITLGLLPSIVCIVIMMVNGNIGAGVAVAGAFSLVRFRSVQGSGKEILAIFLAMTSGLIIGMGYLAYGILFTIIIAFILVLINVFKLPNIKNNMNEKTLRITIPEDLDYTDVFTDIFEKYTSEWKIISVRTTNMGSMFKLTYNITEKNINDEKKMIDEIRVRNGNLEISISEQEIKNDQL
jgi:hypothetical protein